jgi:hypothetical protein
MSGTWTAATDTPQGIAAAPSPVLGARFALRIEGDTLTLTRPAGQDVVATTFALGGAPSRTMGARRLCEAQSQLVETAAWEDQTLVLTVVGSVPAGGGSESKLNVRRRLRLEGPDTLVVEGSMTQAKQTRQVASVYKRSEPLPARAVRSVVSGAPATISQVAWIAGLWVGTSANNGTTEERWTSPASGSMIGMARTLSTGSMTGFEFLCIAERDGSLVYSAMPNGRSPATDFVLTGVTGDGATFENPAHDFPKMIRYVRRADGTLETIVSGDPKQRALSVVLSRLP